MADQVPAVPPNESVSPGEIKHQLQHAQANGEAVANGIPSATDIQQKYEEEKNRRLRDDGDDQYIDIALTEKFKTFSEDPWLDERSDLMTPEDGQTIKFLILGAGFGGLTFAINLIKQGFKPQDILIVDSAGGFGGTWYWNRYPGLMCDVESYVYLPMLEEMNYMPKHKYAYGTEIRQYINKLADHFHLSDRACFRTKVNAVSWSDTQNRWEVSLTAQRQTDPTTRHLNVHAQHFAMASGLLLHPKLPAIPGIETFKGHAFHTSRWDYSFTGGSSDQPTLTNLRDKRVGVIGTGATAVQCVPHLAKHAKHLTVFQRTPSSVDVRGQRLTESNTWQDSIATTPGWHRNRRRNFNLALTNGLTNGAAAPDEPQHNDNSNKTNEQNDQNNNLVNDAWTHLPTYHALIGAPGIVVPDQIPTHIASLYAADFSRSQRVRDRVDTIVSDTKVGAGLKPWYPSWCKRPCFHDDYLDVFNRDNVTLVDTRGKGVEKLTEKGVVVDGKEYEVDVLVFSTGFRSPVLGTPAGKANITITGKNGRTLDQKWDDEGIATLHGVCTREFPNLWWPGPSQAGMSANYVSAVEVLWEHVAGIIREAERRAEKEGEGDGAKVVIEATKEGEEAWTGEVLMRAANLAGMGGCTPSYLNGEGAMDRLPMEERMKRARGSIWGEGIVAFEQELKKWENKGGLEGLSVSWN